MSSSPQPAQSFRSQFGPILRLFAWFMLAYFAVCLGIEGVNQYRNARLPDPMGLLQAALIPLVFGAVWLVIFVLAVLAFKVRVHPQSLHCYNIWGVYRTVKWGDILAVKPASLLGLPYLNVTIPAHSLPLTVPLWLQDMPGFIAAVEAHAGHDHPLTQALRTTSDPVTPQ